MQYSQSLTRVASGTKQFSRFWISEKVFPQLRTFSNKPIRIEGKIQSPITSSGRTFDSATFFFEADGLKSLIGRNLFHQLGLAVTQSTSLKGNLVNNISSSSEFKEQISKIFPELLSRIGRSKNHIAKSKCHKKLQPSHQKVRRIPINLQDKVNIELKKLVGLTDMPAEIRKAMDYTLIGLKNTYCFLDDILVVNKGSLEEHERYVMSCLRRLDDENLRISLPKCHFAKLEIDWLGYHIPLRPLLKKTSKFIWTEAYENCFKEIKNRISNATENSHYNPQLETRVNYDASRSGLGAALEQLTVGG